MRTVAILPVKRFADAKQRLAPALTGAARRALAEAMLTDVLTAVGRVAALGAVLVVSADPAVQRIARRHGAHAIDDPDERGQSEAVARGADAARELGAARVLCLAGDCPLADPAEVAALLGRASGAGRGAVLVADRHGTGTNGLLLSPPDALRPRFGRDDSFARHRALARAAGVAAEVVEVPSLALDVDTPDDLAVLRVRLAARRDGATRTRAVLRRVAA